MPLPPPTQVDGIFQDEQVVAFYIHMKQLVDECFSTLYHLTSEKAKSVCVKNKRDKHPDAVTAVQRRAFKLGIDYILHSWDDKIKEEECSSALQRFPNIEEEYTHCVQQYCDSLRNRANVRGHRTFGRFLYSYICTIASSKDMSEMAYFDRFNFGDKDAFLKELFRTTLMESVRYKGAPRPSGNDNPSILTASTHMSRTASAAARSAELVMAKDAHSSSETAVSACPSVVDTFGSLVSVESRRVSCSVAPSDSVSNAPFRRAVEPSTIVSKPSTVTPRSRLLTRSLLDTHDKRLTNQGTAVRIGAPLPGANVKNITLCM